MSKPARNIYILVEIKISNDSILLDMGHICLVDLISFVQICEQAHRPSGVKCLSESIDITT